MSLDTLVSWSSLLLIILFALNSATPDPEPATLVVLERDSEFYLAEDWDSFSSAVF